MERIHLDLGAGSQSLSTKLSSHLIEQLKNDWSTLEKLPSELELSQQLGVSRTVVRDALSQLEREGLIERVRGVGTVINRDIVRLENRLDLKFEYNKLICNMGKTPAVDSVTLHIAKADELIASKLDINLDDDVIRCEKRILASGVPAIYSIDYLAHEHLDKHSYLDINWSLPIFDVLEEHCGLFIQTSISEVTPVMGPEKIRRLLEVPPDAALLKITECSLIRHNKPVLYSEEYYTNLFQFSILRKKF